MSMTISSYVDEQEVAAAILRSDLSLPTILKELLRQLDDEQGFAELGRDIEGTTAEEVLPSNLWALAITIEEELA